MTQKTKKTMIKSASVAIGLSLLLWGCGGGGGGGGPIAEATTKLTGVAIDGYLEGATAFLDLNDNGKHDSNEPTSATDKQGAFELIATASQFAKHRVVVLVPSGAIDSNTGEVDAPFSLTSPAGQGGVVSPLTTLVAAHMAEDKDLSFEDARTRVAQDLSLEGNVMKDFMADKDLNFQKVAVAVTEILKTTDIVSSKEQLSDIKSNVELKVKSNIRDIQNFAIETPDDWLRLKEFSKEKSEQSFLELNSQWLSFLFESNASFTPSSTTLTNNGHTSPLPIIFNIVSNTNSADLKISAFGNEITRSLVFNDNQELLSVSSSNGTQEEVLKFSQQSSKSLPNFVSIGSKGTYYEGQFIAGNVTCAETKATFQTNAGTEGSLIFILSIEQSKFIENIDCIPSNMGRTTNEIYEFDLKSNEIKIRKIEADLNLPIFGDSKITLEFN